MFSEIDPALTGPSVSLTRISKAAMNKIFNEIEILIEQSIDFVLKAVKDRYPA